MGFSTFFNTISWTVRGCSPSRSLKYFSRDLRTHSAISLARDVMLPTPPHSAGARIAAPVDRKPGYRGQLLLDAWQLVHRVAEAGRAGQSFGVPGNVLARDLDSGIDAIERVQVVQVRDQHLVDLGHERWRQVHPGLEVVLDLAEDPRPALRCAADHDAVGLGVIEHVLGFLRRADVAVRNHRQARGAFDFGDGVVFGVAGVAAGARAPVDRQQLDAAFRGDARDGQGVLVVLVPAGAELERHRRVDRLDHGLQNTPDQQFVCLLYTSPSPRD